ncbi:MAG: TolC family protein [Thermodesulfobacteriota bacterium]
MNHGDKRVCSRSLPFFIKAFLILMSILAFPPGVARSRTLRLDQALAIADGKNRNIQKAMEYRNWVEGYYVEQRSAALPQVTVTSGLFRQRDESQNDYPISMYPVQQDAVTAGVGLSQALFTWGQVGAAIRAADIYRKVADDQLDYFRQAVARDVSQAFYDLLLAKVMTLLAKENLELKKRHMNEAAHKRAAGTATDYDELVARVDYENAQPLVIRRENMIKTATEKLRFLLAEDIENLDVEGSLDTVIDVYPPYEEALECALDHRPELSELRHRNNINQELVLIYDAGDKPRLDLLGNLGWKKYYDEATDPDGLEWRAGLQITYPIFDGLRSRGKVAQAKSDGASLRIEEAKTRDGIALEVRNAVDAIQEAGEIAKALSGTVAQAEKLLSMAEQGYQLGVKTHLDVQDAQLNLLRAKNNLAKAYRDYLVARVTLEWVKGTIRVGDHP